MRVADHQQINADIGGQERFPVRRNEEGPSSLFSILGFIVTVPLLGWQQRYSCILLRYQELTRVSATCSTWSLPLVSFSICVLCWRCSCSQRCAEYRIRPPIAMKKGPIFTMLCLQKWQNRQQTGLKINGLGGLSRTHNARRDESNSNSIAPGACGTFCIRSIWTRSVYVFCEFRVCRLNCTYKRSNDILASQNSKFASIISTTTKIGCRIFTSTTATREKSATCTHNWGLDDAWLGKWEDCCLPRCSVGTIQWKKIIKNSESTLNLFFWTTATIILLNPTSFITVNNFKPCTQYTGSSTTNCELAIIKRYNHTILTVQVDRFSCWLQQQRRRMSAVSSQGVAGSQQLASEPLVTLGAAALCFVSCHHHQFSLPLCCCYAGWSQCPYSMCRNGTTLWRKKSGWAAAAAIRGQASLHLKWSQLQESLIPDSMESACTLATDEPHGSTDM